MIRFVFAALISLLAVPATAAEILFQSPSGNIKCLLTDETTFGVRCDLGVDRQTYSDPPADCSGRWGTSFALGPTGPGRVNCAISQLPERSGALTLPYGASVGYAGVLCRSEPFGMICTNGEGGGFNIRRAGQRVF